MLTLSMFQNEKELMRMKKLAEADAQQEKKDARALKMIQSREDIKVNTQRRILALKPTKSAKSTSNSAE